MAPPTACSRVRLFLQVARPGGLGFRLGFEGGVAGADVVAVLVVGVLAERLTVLGCHLAALCRLLDRQADAPPGQVDVDDLDPQLLARA